MANMGYCRFENTVQDLEDCQEHMEDTGLSSTEITYRRRLIELCIDIANDFGDMEDD
jgi:hypothetical protein